MRIGICLPISERGVPPLAMPYAGMRELAQASEAGGLDSIWVADHLFFEADDGNVRGAWEALSILGGLAEATERVELGPFVLCAPFRNPGLIAWMANTLDAMSGGRFVLGLGCGWNEHEFQAFGFEFERKVSYFEDALNVVVPLLREGRADHDGRLTSGHGPLRPPGPRAGGPPIMIAASAPRMMSLTARWADRWNTVWYGLPTDEFRAERDALRRACAAAERDPGEIQVTVGVAVNDPAETAFVNNAQRLGGTVESIAAGLAAWQAEGIDEVMCRLEPPSVALVQNIARATMQLRGQ